MEMRVEFNPFELRRLQRQLESTHKATGITVQWLCWDQMRLACKDAIKYMAPWANGAPGTGGAQRKQGESAVSNDLDRLFARKDDDKYVFFTSRSNGKKYARNKVKGIVFEIPDQFFDVDLKRYHLQNRNARGRVARQKKQAWVEPSLLSKYIKEVQNRVGSLKASWIPAYDAFSMKVGAAARVPAWISKQLREGYYTDAMRNDGNGSLISTSAAHHSQGIRRDTIKFIEGLRNKSMRTYSERRIQQIADQFNAQRTNIQPIRQNAAA